MDTIINFTPEEFQITHFADNRAVLRAVKEEREKGNNGWTANRQFQKIGSIPALEYARLIRINPELKDGKALEKWLMSDAGAGYRVANDNPHRCTQIIIK